MHEQGEMVPGLILDNAVRAASRERSERTNRIMANKTVIQNMSVRTQLQGRSKTPDRRSNGSSQSQRGSEFTPTIGTGPDQEASDSVLPSMRAPLTDPVKSDFSAALMKQRKTVDALSPYIRGNTSFVQRPLVQEKRHHVKHFPNFPRDLLLPSDSPTLSPRAGERPGSNTSGRLSGVGRTVTTPTLSKLRVPQRTCL